MAGIGALYLGLALWFTRLGIRLVQAAGTKPEYFFFSVPAFFLAFLLWKGLFSVRRGELGEHLEVTAETEPDLVAFVHRVADEVGAPRPHRIFLTPDVNAAVFYDLSIWSLIWPTRKNLAIGLGLVNVLTLDEIKAVLAHEFGHFAQREMRVSNWVYVGQQAIGAVVQRRDLLDRFLDGLSRFDIRIAWIGWAMRLLIWSVRVVLDTAFRGVVLAQRALSREMEFQADLVAVSISGSDSLVHGLRRLGAADTAMQRAFEFATAQGRAQSPLLDVFAAQTQALDQLRSIWRDPTLGEVPARPMERPEAHRLFSAEIAEVPRMWSTHPPSHEREENAKRRYVPSVLDPRPAWVIFADPDAMRRRMTAFLYERNMKDAVNCPTAAPEESRERFEKLVDRPAFAAAYNGVYVGRSVVRGARAREELVGPIPTDRETVASMLAGLYPTGLLETLKAHREAMAEVAQLQALVDGVLTAPGGVIRYRGKVIRRAELAPTIRTAEEHRDRLAAVLAEHDRRVRGAHRGAARLVGQGWEAALTGQLAALHFLEHLHANLLDANAHLQSVFAVVTADRKVSERELQRVILAANELQAALESIYARPEAVTLPAPVLTRLGVASWKALLGEELKLPLASREGLAGNWLPAAGTWVQAAHAHLDRAEDAALDTLLEAEAHVRRCFESGDDPGPAPSPPRIPTQHPTLAPGQERPKARKLDLWTRFVTADGFGPGLARLVVASAVLAPALAVGGMTGEANVIVHNGLDRAVRVQLGDDAVMVGPGQDLELTVPATDELPISTMLPDGRPIESFTEDASRMQATYVYDVASAGALVMGYATYGDAAARDPELLGAPRWLRSTADDTFTEPPSSVANGPTTRAVLAAIPEASRIVDRMDPEEAKRMVTAHLTWDPIDSGELAGWFGAAKRLGMDTAALYAARTPEERGSIELGRVAQDVGIPGACDEARERAKARPEDGDAAYLAVRCAPEASAAEETLAALAKFPEHPWIRWAAGYERTRRGEWQAALDAWSGLELPALGDRAGTERARLMRILGQPYEVQAEQLDGQERELLAREAGRETTTADDPLAAIAGGDLERASVLAAKAGASGEPYLGVIAVSDGATPEMIAAAKPGAAVGGAASFWVALAREPDRRAELLEQFQPDEPFRSRLTAVLDAPPADLVAAVDAAIAGTSASERGFLELLGWLRSEGKGPQRWHDEARALLLPSERPWLGRPAK